MFIDDLTTFRIRARLTIAELAKLSGVSRDTVSRIEKHKPSSLVTLCKIVDVLNTVYFTAAGEVLNDGGNRKKCMLFLVPQIDPKGYKRM